MIGKFFQKPDAEDDSRTPPGQYLTKGFPVLTYGATPQIDRSTWQLRVWGLATEKVFIWDDIMGLPQHDFTADFHCVTRWSRLDAQWRGVKVTDFMQLVEFASETAHILEHAYGGYTTNIAIGDFLREENFFAHTLLGEPLPPDHGAPLRLVVPHLYAWKSAKWINGLEFLVEEKLGFWERNGYHTRGEPWAEERYSE